MYESPSTLVAIIVAARRAGDRELERDARRSLEDRYGVRLSFARESADTVSAPLGGRPCPLMRLLSVADTAARLRISDDAVLAHIRAGRLRAANVGLGPRRPRWRITEEALETYLAAATVTPAPARRRRRRDAAVTEYF